MYPVFQHSLAHKLCFDCRQIGQCNFHVVFFLICLDIIDYHLKVNGKLYEIHSFEDLEEIIKLREDENE